VNEVTLMDWSEAVASLYKSSLAGALLGVKPDPDNLCWRLLRINFDVLGLYTKAIKIADLLGYQNVINEACAEVKRLVEEEYPLGNEIYRDTTGIYFTFPDIDLPTDLEREIRCRMEKRDHEIAPRIYVYAPNGKNPTEQLKVMLAEGRKKALDDLAYLFDTNNHSPHWESLWKNLNLDDKQYELCPVCRLRPMREGKEACENCLKRRESRMDTWLTSPQNTIWMDEIADENGRVALLVGRFGMDDWLSGDLVQTMLVKAEKNNPAKCTPKNPSPARLRRVWETCQKFWEETVKDIIDKENYGGGSDLRCSRLAIIPNHSNWEERVPYDGTINGRPVSLLWQGDKERFITISNLQLAISPQSQDIDVLVEGWRNKSCVVSLPDDPKKRATFTITQVGKLPQDEPISPYKPYLPLLESPIGFWLSYRHLLHWQSPTRSKRHTKCKWERYKIAFPSFWASFISPAKCH